MGYPLTLARRYLSSKKRNMISISTALAIGGVTLGVAALAIVMSVTGGFQEQFREKVLGVNAHVLVLKYSIDFREYRDIMKKVEHVPGVIGIAPFVINPMMLTHGDRTATGVLLKGVDPEAMPKVLDLPKHIVEGDMRGMRKLGAKPPERMADPSRSTTRAPQGDAGAPIETKSLLDVMRERVDSDMAKLDAGLINADGTLTDAGAALLDAGAPAAGPIRAANAAKHGGLDAGVAAAGPIGDVTPDGGYKSELPDVDIIPDDIDPDPCRDPREVAKMAGVVIGRTLSKQLGANIGDCVQVTSPTIGLSYGASARPPIAKQFRVIAIFEAGFDQYDSKLVYTDLYEAQAFYEYGDSVTGVEMKVDDIERARDIAREIDGILANGVYHTMDWRELNHGLFTALVIQQWGMSGVLFLIIVVAAFTVIATLIMVVLDKKKEIALLKAIGARDDAILRVFLYQGGIIGVTGTCLGLGLGFVCLRFLLYYGFPLDPKVYFISRLPVSMHPMEFILTGTAAIVVCLIATIFPAMYAARLRPSDGLRAE
jgi:lipoprotein-releasing system permease protein